MEALLVLLVIALILGLLSRSKGDGLLDTLSSGCSTMVWLLVLLVLGIVVIVVIAAG